jgi:hypothetical protein
MSSEQPGNPEVIPEDLRYLADLNTVYCVLCYVECKEAVYPRSFVEYLKHFHQVPWEVYKRVKRYIEGFRHNYEHSTIQLPDDGLAPQPLLPVTRGFNCKECSKARNKFQSISAV